MKPKLNTLHIPTFTVKNRAEAFKDWANSVDYPKNTDHSYFNDVPNGAVITSVQDGRTLWQYRFKGV